MLLEQEGIMKTATREAYGQTLCELGKIRPDLVVLDADLSEATKTCKFHQAYPDRFIDCGIEEANMMGIAAGLASCGLMPFVSTFAIFAAGRAYEQIRNSIAYPNLNVKIAATHAGISVGEDGATHQAIEDLALMRVIPGMTVFSPCDAAETKACIKAAAEINGPVYIRLGRLAVDPVYDESTYHFNPKKGIILHDGTDLALLATGLEVQESLKAAQMLEEAGISCLVADIAAIKPIDEDLIRCCAKKTNCILTVEEHSIIGGLGSAVCEVLSESAPCKVRRIGIDDRFGQSGPADELLRLYGLDYESIFQTALEFWEENQPKINVMF